MCIFLYANVCESVLYFFKDDGHLSVIFSFLSGNQLRSACQVAKDNKEIRLAFLLSQSAGDHHMKHYLRSQLTQWEESNVWNPDF